MNNYYKELQNLVLDQNDVSFLRNIKMSFKDQAKIMISKNPDGSPRYFPAYKSFFLRDSRNDYSGNDLFKKIAHICKNTPDHHDIKYIYHRAHFAHVPDTLPYHIDIRGCVLTIPIEPIVKPVEWVDEQEKILCTYDYKHPALINTKIRHGCPSNTSDRFFFQIGFDQSFAQIANLLQD